MVRKILVFSIIFSFLIQQSSFVMAQFADITQIKTQIKEEAQVRKETPSQEEGYQKFMCPTCGRDFAIAVDPNDLELKKGIKKVICPYDGTEFYPNPLVSKEEELQYETVRCPTCGKEFKAYIDVKALLAGEPQVLICP